jgi:hypothetical protein
MIPASIDFVCQTNADCGEEFLVRDGNNSIDTVGLRVKLTARLHPTGSVLFVLNDVGAVNSQGVRFLPGGVLQIVIDKETAVSAYETASITQVNSNTVQIVHDVLVTYPDGFVETWGHGLISIEHGVG